MMVLLSTEGFVLLKNELKNSEYILKENSMLHIKHFKDNIHFDSHVIQLPIRAVLYFVKQEISIPTVITKIYL